MLSKPIMPCTSAVGPSTEDALALTLTKEMNTNRNAIFFIFSLQPNESNRFISATFLPSLSQCGKNAFLMGGASKKLDELVRVYEDLENTLKILRKKHLYDRSTLAQINVKKLIVQLSRSKRSLERKISNTILMEKQLLKRRWQSWMPKAQLKPRKDKAGTRGNDEVTL